MHGYFYLLPVVIKCSQQKQLEEGRVNFYYFHIKLLSHGSLLRTETQGRNHKGNLLTSLLILLHPVHPATVF